MLDRNTPPPVGKITRINFAKAKSIYLSNGLPVHIIDAGQHEIIRLEIIFKSGKWYEKINGQAFFTSHMLLEGTSEMSSRQIADIFEFNGAHVNMNSGIDYNILTVYVLNKKLVEISEIIKDCILNSVFPEEELNILKDIQKQQIRINNEKNSFLAGREIRKLLYGTGHPYSRVLETEDIDQHVNSAISQEFYDQELLKGVEIIVSGIIHDDILESLQVFNDIPIIAGSIRSHKIGTLSKSEIFIPRKESLQSSIRIGRRIIHKTHEDFIGLIIMNELFGGFFGSRLMKNIREDKGYTYGIHSSIVTHLNDSFLVIGTDVKKDFVRDTIEQIYLEMDKLRNDPIGPEEMDLIRNYMLGNFLSSLETSFALADKFKNVYFFGLDYSFYDKYIDTVNVITPQRIQELAIKYLDPSEFKMAVVG